MADFETQTGGTDADWDDIELELECSGREAGISGVTFASTAAGPLPWAAAPWPFTKKLPA
jgi:hypothetical protein